MFRLLGVMSDDPLKSLMNKKLAKRLRTLKRERDRKGEKRKWWGQTDG